MNEIRVLIEEIRKGLLALEKIEGFYERVVAGLDASGRNEEKAVVIAELLSKHYTCLETKFLRVSQFFENNLSRERWHSDLLDRMTLSIEGVREAVLRDETRDLLLEFLKFRHFTRYYYDIGYDWDRLAYLMKKFRQVRPMVHDDFGAFLQFLEALDAADTDTASIDDNPTKQFESA